MAQIGIALVGRHPGFTVFSRINWQGPDPEDKNIRSSSLGDTYYSAVIDSQYATYELVICNFVSNTGRNEVFRIIMRIPSGHTVLNEFKAPVSPSFILNEIRKELTGTSLILFGSSYKFQDGVVRPVFPDARIAELVAGFNAVPSWGKTMVMLYQSQHPFYVNAQENEIGAMLSQLPLCERLKEASTVYLGMFNDSAQPQFTFTEDELTRKPDVTVSVRNADGKVSKVELDSSMKVFESSQFGYSLLAYENVEISLMKNDVFNAWQSGNSLSNSEFVSIGLNPEYGEVDVVFRPKPLEKQFTVRLEGVKPQQPLDLSALRSTIFSDNPESVTEAGFMFKGEGIVAFERNAQSMDWLRQRISLVPDTHYRMDGVSLNGTVITVVVKYIPPVTKKKNPAIEERNNTGKGNRSLIIVAPVSSGLKNEAVCIESRKVLSPRYYFITGEVTFVTGRDNAQLEATMEVPEDIDPMQCTFGLGVPPRLLADITTGSDGNLYVNLGNNAKAMGFFSRQAELFSYKYDLRGAKSVLRMILPMVIALFILLAGFVLGFFLSNNTRTVIDMAQSVTETVDGVSGPASGGNEDQNQESEAVREEPRQVPGVDYGRPHGSDDVNHDSGTASEEPLPDQDIQAQPGNMEPGPITSETKEMESGYGNMDNPETHSKE